MPYPSQGPGDGNGVIFINAHREPHHDGWMAVVIAPYIVFVLMLDLLHFVFRSRVACLWIGPRLALAARCG